MQENSTHTYGRNKSKIGVIMEFFFRLLTFLKEKEKNEMVARPYSTAILLAGQIVVRDAGFSNRHVDPAWLLLHRRVDQQQQQCCWFLLLSFGSKTPPSTPCSFR